MTRLLFAVMLLVGTCTALAAQEQSAAPNDAQQLEMRARYEQALLRSPLQDQAFDRVYSSYLEMEGVDAWLKRLEDPAIPESARLILQGRTFERQFKHEDAVAALEKAQAAGESSPEFMILLGTLYYQAGIDQKAIDALTGALGAVEDAEKRAAVARMIGALYLRNGKRDEAIASWKKLVEQAPEDLFAHLELAEIYEDNRMWQDAIGVYEQIIALSPNDPYRQCRALRSIGECHIYLEQFKEAIAIYEKALEQIAPGNWLFEDIKLRLVGVYQDLGDLEGLAGYLTAKVEAAPGDVEFRDLLAETYGRMGKFPEAETQYAAILERDPQRASTHEKLLALYERMSAPEKVVAEYEELLKLYPNDQDYLRRLGEYFLRQGKTDEAKAAWQRVVATPSARAYADLADWYEMHDFSTEAIGAFQQALGMEANRDWSLRLAALQFELGQETEALATWNSLVAGEAVTGAEIAEVAGILDSHSLLEQANALWAQAVEKAPETLEHRLALAKSLVALKRPEEALPHYEKLAAQPENPYLRDQGERGMVEVYRDTKTLKDKQTEWELLEASEPENAETLTRLARLYTASGNADKSLELYERALEIQPDNPEHLRNLAMLYKSRRQTEESIALFNRLIEIDKTRAGGYYRDLVDTYLSADDREHAIAAAQKVVELSPSDPEARLQLAQVFMIYQQTEEAFQQYRFALRLEPNEPQYHRQYGEALAAERRFGEAQEAFRKMLETAVEDETRQNAVRMLSGIYAQQNQLDDLKQEFKARVRNTPKRLSAYEELAAIYDASGEPLQGLEILEEGYQAVDDKTPALKTMVRQAYAAQDFQRVVTYYQELIALSGKPGSQEYQNLGRVYLQLGDVEKARETWNKIVEAEPDKPESYTMLARLMKDGGFTEESLAATAKALELKPENFRLRYEYAQALIEADQTDSAYEQLQTILDEGGRSSEQEEEKSDSKEKQVKRVQQQGVNWQRTNMFSASYSPGQGYYYGGLQGQFAEFRPQVIVALARLAENSIGVDEMLKEYEQRAADDPESTSPKYDLMLIYQTINQPDKALEIADQLIAVRPDDVDLIRQASSMHAARQDMDRAVELMEGLLQSEPSQRKETLLALASLYQRKNDKAKADELVTTLAAEYGNDYNLYYQLLSLLQETGNMALIEQLREKARQLPLQYRTSISLQFAQIYQKSNELEKARAVYQEVLAEEPAPQRGMSRGARQAIYTPSFGQGNQGFRVSGSGRAYYQLRNVIQSIDYTRGAALDSLVQMHTGEPESEPALAGFLAEVGRYRELPGGAEKKRARADAYLAAAFYVGRDDKVKASAILDQIQAADTPEIDWYNFKIYLHEQAGEFAEMMKLYEALQAAFPSRKTDIILAMTNVAFLGGDYQKAADCIRELHRRALAPARTMPLIQYLVEAKESDLAKAILEEHLSGMSRNSEALRLLAKLHAEDNEYEQALALAKEAWGRKGGPGSSGSSAMNMFYGYYYRQPPASEALLQEVHSYAQHCAKTTELIAEFQERLAKQPGSVQLHQDLATLYALNDDRDNAVRVYKELLEKRPHQVSAKMQLAEFYESKNQFQEAMAVYEELMAKNPTVYRSMSWRIRDLYGRMGQGGKLKEMEDEMVAKATNANQMQQMAYDFQNQGRMDKAIEMWEKVIKIDLRNSWYAGQLCECYLQVGRVEDAFKLYNDIFESQVKRQQLAQDPANLARLVMLHRVTGRMDELKTKIDQQTASDPLDEMPKAVRAELLKQEKQFDEATTLLEELLRQPNNYGAIQNLSEIAKYKGGPSAALDILEKSGNLQSNWNSVELVPLYLTTGRRDKAVSVIKARADAYGGNYGIRESFEQFVQYGMWDEAADYYIQNRRRAGTDWPGREMDESVVRLYTSSGRLSKIVDQILAQPIKGDGLQLIKALLNESREGDDKMAALVPPLLEREPDNKELLGLWADALWRKEKSDEALPIYERLVALDPNERPFHQGYARCLRALGREDESLAYLQQWASAGFTFERGEALAQALGECKRGAELLKLQETALQAVDVSLKEPVQLRMGELLGELGGRNARRDMLKQLMEQKGDQESAGAYLEYLVSMGWDQEALAALAAAEQANKLDRSMMMRRGGSFVGLYARSGALTPALENSWAFIESQERYNLGYYFQRMHDSFEELGEHRLFLDFVLQKLEAGGSPDMPKYKELAQGLHETGQGEAALALYDKVLAVNPYDHETQQSKARVLQDLGRVDEAIELLRNIRGAQNLAEEARDSIALLQALLAAGRVDEADQAAAALSAWAADPQTRLEIAQCFFGARQYEKALGAMGEGWQTAGDRTGIAAALCIARAALGQTEEALAFYRAEMGGHDLDTLLGPALEHHAYAFIDAALRESLADGDRRASRVAALARVQQATNNAEDGVSVFEEFSGQLDATQRKELAGLLGHYLLANNLAGALLDRGQLSPFLAWGVAVACGRLDEVELPAQFSGRIAQLAALPLETAEANLAMGAVLNRLKAKTESAACFRKALAQEGLTFQQQCAAYGGLAEADDGGEVPAALVAAVEHNLSLLMDNPRLIKLIMRAATPGELSRIETALETLPAYAGQKAYFQGVKQYYAGDIPGGVSAMLAALDTAELTTSQVECLSKLCAEAGDNAGAARAWEALAAGGYGRGQQQQAQVELVKRCLAQGDAAGAVRWYAELLPGISEHERRACGEFFRYAVSGDLAAVRAALLAVIQEKPEHVRNQQLAGLYLELMEQQVADPQFAQFLAESGMSPEQRLRAEYWPRLIEAWQVAGPFPREEERTMPRLPDAVAAMARGEAAPGAGDGLNWTPATESSVRGMVEFPLQLGRPVASCDEKTAYAVTTLNSPDERPVTFSLGWDDAIVVWLNGNPVYRSNHAHSAYPDQARFHATLRTGKNTVLVRVGNAGADWAFGLAMIENDAGVTVAAGS